MLQQSVLFPAAGLNELWTNILNNWVGPLFIAAVAVFAIVFIKDRAWMKLVSFVGIAAIVGVLVFFGKDMFGSSGTLTKAAKGNATKVTNTVVSPGLR